MYKTSFSLLLESLRLASISCNEASNSLPRVSSSRFSLCKFSNTLYRSCRHSQTLWMRHAASEWPGLTELICRHILFRRQAAWVFLSPAQKFLRVRSFFGLFSCANLVCGPKMKKWSNGTVAWFCRLGMRQPLALPTIHAVVPYSRISLRQENSTDVALAGTFCSIRARHSPWCTAIQLKRICKQNIGNDMSDCVLKISVSHAIFVFNSDQFFHIELGDFQLFGEYCVFFTQLFFLHVTNKSINPTKTISIKAFKHLDSLEV